MLTNVRASTSTWLSTWLGIWLGIWLSTWHGGVGGRRAGSRRAADEQALWNAVLMFREAYCRNCGVLLRGAFGRWWHAQRLGPVPCPGAEPEPEGPAPGS